MFVTGVGELCLLQVLVKFVTDVGEVFLLQVLVKYVCYRCW